jgi:hypothetical protein
LPLQNQANKPTKHLKHQNNIDVVLLSITQCIPHFASVEASCKHTHKGQMGNEPIVELSTS